MRASERSPRGALAETAGSVELSARDSMSQTSVQRELLRQLAMKDPSKRPKKVMDSFSVKKTSYDQSFICKEDEPLTKRRTTLTYYP